jgi:hypothetical protein
MVGSPAFLTEVSAILPSLLLNEKRERLESSIILGSLFLTALAHELNAETLPDNSNVIEIANVAAVMTVDAAILR